MKNDLKEKIKCIILIFFIIIFIIAMVPKEFQNDTFFAIATGKNILKNGVQTEEKLVWHENLKFTNSRWLFDFLINIIYSKFYFVGIYVFVVIIAILQELIYFRIVYSITKNKSLSFIFTIINIYLLKDEFTGRAQIISFLLFLIEYYSINKLLETNKKIYLIVLPIISILLANFHASVFPMYFIIYLPYIAEAILSKIIKIKDDKVIIEKRNIRNLLIALIFGFIFSFCVPNGVKVYSDMVNVTKGISSNIISELNPVNIKNCVELIICFIVVIFILTFTKTKVKITDLLFILGFGILSLNTIRCVFFFYLISSIGIIRIINDFIKEYNISLDFMNSNLKKIVSFFLIFLLVTISIRRITENLHVDYIYTQDYPVDAINYIVENIDISNMKIYNHFNFGSYLEFRGIKAFIDSRSGVFTEEFNPGTTILEDWNNIVSGSVSYKDIFDKYGITHVLLYNDEIINTYIKYDKDYNLLYQDDSFSLYEKVSNDK